MKKLYFIRHGESEFGVQRRIAGSSDTPLTDKGRAQAKRAGQALRNRSIDLIVSSPLSRSLETAKIIADEISYPRNKILTHELLVEREHGEGEGKPWVPGFTSLGYKGMETDDELVERSRKALEWIKSHPADNVLVVGHGASGRALRSLVKKDFPMSHPQRLGNAELHEWL